MTLEGTPRMALNPELSSEKDSSFEKAEALLQKWTTEIQRAEKLTLHLGQMGVAFSKIRFRERLWAAFLAGLIPTLALGGGILWFFSSSLDFKLRSAGVQWKLRTSPQGTEIQLKGKNLKEAWKQENSLGGTFE